MTDDIYHGSHNQQSITTYILLIYYMKKTDKVPFALFVTSWTWVSHKNLHIVNAFTMLPDQSMPT